jgi:DtxR family Mn-dependent transcriptional regulator
MCTLWQAGVQPGAVVRVTSSPGGVMVGSGGEAAELPTQTAAHVFVSER